MRELLYETHLKKVYTSTDSTQLFVEYKNDEDIEGAVTNKIINILLRYLEANHVSTCYIAEVSDTETIVKNAINIPLGVTVRNISAGSFCDTYNKEQGIVFATPIIEFSYLAVPGGPLIAEDTIVALDILTYPKLKEIRATVTQINALLQEFFKNKGQVLVDFTVGFAELFDGTVILSEISPCSYTVKDVNPVLISD